MSHLPDNELRLIQLGREADFAREVSDLLLAQSYQGELLTYGQLAELLGFDTTQPSIDTVAFVNACWHAGENPTVQALQGTERIKAIASAAAAFENIMTRREL